MMRHPRQLKWLSGVTLLVFWGSNVLGLILPWIVFVATAGNEPEVWGAFWRELWGAQPGLLWAGLLNAVPFVVFAIFTLFHLGTAAPSGVATARRRMIGVLIAALLMLTASLWFNLAIWTSRSSTAAIGFVFLPIYLLLVFPIGYGLGRLLARVWVRG